MLFIFLLDLSSALEIGASPPEIEINASINEKACKTINVFSSEAINFSVKDKWFTKGSRKDISSYNSNLTDGQIEYEHSFILNKLKNIDFCFTGFKEKEYSGLIIFEADGRGAAVGVWLEANVKDYEGVWEKGIGQFFSNISKERIIVAELTASSIIYVVLFGLLLGMRKKTVI